MRYELLGEGDLLCGGSVQGHPQTADHFPVMCRHHQVPWARAQISLPLLSFFSGEELKKKVINQ